MYLKQIQNEALRIVPTQNQLIWLICKMHVPMTHVPTHSVSVRPSSTSDEGHYETSKSTSSREVYQTGTKHSRQPSKQKEECAVAESMATTLASETNYTREGMRTSEALCLKRECTSNPKHLEKLYNQTCIYAHSEIQHALCFKYPGVRGKGESARQRIDTPMCTILLKLTKALPEKPQHFALSSSLHTL